MNDLLLLRLEGLGAQGRNKMGLSHGTPGPSSWLLEYSGTSALAALPTHLTPTASGVYLVPGGARRPCTQAGRRLGRV